MSPDPKNGGRPCVGGGEGGELRGTKKYHDMTKMKAGRIKVQKIGSLRPQITLLLLVLLYRKGKIVFKVITRAPNLIRRPHFPSVVGNIGSLNFDLQTSKKR